MTLKLRPHQKAAVKASLEYFEERGDGSRGILHMACASGKTVSALRIAEGLDGPLVLVCVPTISLVAQLLNEWTAHTEIPFRSICVCSDETVVDGVHELSEDYGLDVTTNVDTIANFIGESDNAEWSVVFSTYHSTPTVSEALLSTGKVFDLIICDEGHRTATGGKKGEGCFKIVLDDDIIPGRRRLFLTATPRTYNRRIKAKAAAEGYDVASMDDPDRYGEIIYQFSFAQAIKKKVLSDYRVILMTVTSKEIQELINERAFVHSDEEAVDAATLAMHIALAKSIRRFGLKKIIVYHSKIDDAKKFSDVEHPYGFLHSIMATSMLEDRTVWTDSVSSRMRANKRLRVLNRLRESSDISIVSNAKCLTEGVDVPSLDAIMFTHPKHSVVDIVQAVGRAIRIPTGWRSKGRDDYPPPGHIIIPVIINDDDPDASIDATSYNTIGAVIRQLRTVDEGLGEVIDLWRLARGERLPTDPQSTAFDKLMLIDIPDGLDAELLKTKIRSKIVELSSDFWQSHYNALADYAKITGHARPPTGRYAKTDSPGSQSHVHKGFKIGDWVSRQRVLQRRGLMPHFRSEMLEQLPGWSWDPNQDAWDNRVQEYLDFTAGKIARPKHLWKWVSRIREQYSDGKLSDERIAQLESIDGWSWVSTRYGNRGNKKVETTPSESQLIDDFKELHAFTKVAKKYGVSDNAVRKWFLSYGWTKGMLKKFRPALGSFRRDGDPDPLSKLLTMSKRRRAKAKKSRSE